MTLTPPCSRSGMVTGRASSPPTPIHSGPNALLSAVQARATLPGGAGPELDPDGSPCPWNSATRSRNSSPPEALGVVVPGTAVQMELDHRTASVHCPEPHETERRLRVGWQDFP